MKNKQIENFIDGIGDGYDLSMHQLNFLTEYDKCYDEGVGDKLVRMAWLSCFENFVESDKTSGSLPVKALVPFLGAGKFILQSPQNIGFHTFNQDYYCHFIAENTTSGRQIKSYVNYDFGSIAEYFMVYPTIDTPSFDVIFCQPPKKCKLASLDSDNAMANIALNDTRLYYFLRSTNFMRKGSVLVMFVPKSEADSFMYKTGSHTYQTSVRLSFDDFFEDPSDDNEFIAIKYTAV
tara:strand:+ start:1230 stop:1934 length:705 start_codon:yes stop_codon:yes gene_type:complete